MTFVATASVVLQAGATPVFVDIDSRTGRTCVHRGRTPQDHSPDPGGRRHALRRLRARRGRLAALRRRPWAEFGRGRGSCRRAGWSCRPGERRRGLQLLLKQEHDDGGGGMLVVADPERRTRLDCSSTRHDG
ncbi:hypothetical protein HBB16_11435 [Pseudonocardia sp. MCCB 268]|nr:hypothetical protein [Pseudonocardia cytotoxica]